MKAQKMTQSVMVALVVAAAVAVAAPAQAKPDGFTVPPAGAGRSVAGKAAPKAPRPALAVDAHAEKRVAAATAPRVRAAGAGDPAVKVLKRTARDLTFQVGRTGAVEVDYAGSRRAFGGDYAARLRVVDTRTGAVMPARNDVAAGKLRVSAAAGTTYAVTAGPSGAAGSFAPTSLAPSATWAVGIQSGDFSWNYPIQVPPAPGPAPQVALAYTSSVVDGRTASTNNQASWLGEGFSFDPGFIERTYTACAEDGAAGKGDLCWDRQAAHLVLPGITGELVWDAGRNVWRVANDDGWRVELRTGAGNGDNDGEHWVVTGPDGTQYSFGRTTAAKSTWTVPVFGNDAGEPCHGPSFETSWCHQAYRWTLDTVTDPHGDQITYHYDTEVNHYGRAGTPSNATPYVRGGHLTRIDYGQRAGAEPSARVVFTSAPRCAPNSACQASQPADWPDTPWDLDCAGGSCAAAGPSFWGTKRLAKITTQVRDGGQFTDVDSWSLAHIFPATNDPTSPTLWLRSILHTGHVGGTASLPEVLFDGVRLPNRIGAGDGEPPMNKWRLSRIYSEAGGVTEVAYQARCEAGTLPRQDVNEKNCFPAYWLPQGAAAPKLGWFHKYVVREVAEVDRVSQAPRKATQYEYVDTGVAAWHYDAAELVPGRFKTWGSWRGFQKVKVRTGGAGGPQMLTEHLFMRGMHDDLLLDGSRRRVTVANSQGTALEDKPGYAGFARETIVRDAVTGAEISAEFQEPWLSEPTAVRDRESGPLEARILKVDSVQTRTVLAAGGARVAKTATKYDGYGSVIEVHDHGDVAVPDDDICTTTSYARNTTAWLVDLPKRVLAAAVPCGTAPKPADVVSDERTYYDGADSVDAAPAKGDVTRTERLSSWDGAEPRYVTTSRAGYDQHGRIVEAYDALGAKTTTAYQPAAGGPVTKVTVTNPRGHASVTELDAGRGLARATVDANGRRGARAYDPLGRLTAAWQPGRPANQPPTVRHEYLIRPDAPAVITTHALLGDGGYGTTHTLYDGLLRERQTQRPAPGGGRIVTDTLYDAHGRVARTNAGYHNDGDPSASLLVVTDSAVPSQEVVEYDGAGRTSAEILRSYGTELHRTSYRYGGDRVSVDPPAGGTPTTEVTDVRDRLVELWQYTGDGPSGDHLVTKYGYTKAGLRSSVTDPAGNVWRYGYDTRGRQVRVEDPDKGTATMTYDDKDRLATVTDARNVTLAYTYDTLDRRTGVFEGSPSGRRLTEWTYDTAPNGVGEPAAAIRYVDGAAYRTETLGYEAHGWPTGTAVTIPSRERGLAGRYESTVDYNQVGQEVSATLPAAGDLPAETVTTGYDALGRVATVGSGLEQYVAETGYTNVGLLGYRILGGRVMRSYGYEDGTRRLTGLRTELDTGAVAVDLGLRYDPAGNVVASADAAGDTQCFRHDALRRLVAAWTATDDCAAGPSLAVLGGPAPYWHSYGYDDAGNRTREVRHAAGGDTVRDHAYPAAGGAGPHRLQRVTTGSRVDSYGYDAAGNTVSRPGQTLTWSAEGRLAGVDAGGQATSFEYDADGARLIRRDPDGSTLYLGDTEVRVDSAGAVRGTRHYRVDGDTVAVRTGAGLAWLADDHAGTAGAAIDGDDLAVTVQRRLPYGAPRGAAATGWPGERGFVGGTTDAATGLTHLGAREYDPELGAFLSVDPILDAGSPQQLHGYAYAGNSPVTYADPSGLTAELALGSAPSIDWDGAVTGFRLLEGLASGALYTPQAAAQLPGARGNPDLHAAITHAIGTRSWSPKVPPGYTVPPGTTTPEPGRPTPLPNFPNLPSLPSGGGSADYPFHDPGEGTWLVKCQTQGAVHSCQYTPVTSYGSYSGYSSVECAGFGMCGGSQADYYEEIHGGDIFERDMWEYDQCTSWNPCDNKPGKIEGYSPPGLYGKKATTKKPVTKTKTGSASGSKPKQNKSSPAKSKKKK
ncbi:RHS repeat-associated core domain-containing protein [Actinomycetes bacterium KLBMP 9797]